VSEPGPAAGVARLAPVVGLATRVLIVGSPGAGKSTLARFLAGVTGVPAVHLDDEYWGPDWRRQEHDAWTRHLRVLCGGDRWIIDGNYLPTLPLRAARATLIVLVDAATPVCLVRVLRRAVRVWRGDPDSLPERVRAQARQGQRVSATRDFVPLLRLVLRFRRRDWWQVVDVTHNRASAQLVVAVVPGLLRHRVRLVRHRLARRGIDAAVVALPDLAVTWLSATVPGHQ
jgi:adenylate kinase family enzyme